MHTRTRLMAAAAAVAVVGALATGCGDREQPGRNVADQAPANAAPSSPTATPTPAKPKNKAHKPHKKKRAHHPRRTARHHHPKRTHRAPAPHKTTKPKPSPSSTGIGTATERKVVKLVNKQRAKAGCTSLRTDRRLRKAAYLHSRDMGVKHYFDHNSKDGRTPWDRIRAQGYKYPSAENIAAGQPTPASVMDAWMHSEGHRANILNCDYKAIGVGVWKGSGGPIWTQDFGFK